MYQRAKASCLIFTFFGFKRGSCPSFAAKSGHSYNQIQSQASVQDAAAPDISSISTILLTMA